MRNPAWRERLAGNQYDTPAKQTGEADWPADRRGEGLEQAGCGRLNGTDRKLVETNRLLSDTYG